MVNKDFIRQVFSGEKSLVVMVDVKMCEVPAYDELSVSSLWPRV